MINPTPSNPSLRREAQRLAEQAASTVAAMSGREAAQFWLYFSYLTACQVREVNAIAAGYINEKWP